MDVDLTLHKCHQLVLNVKLLEYVYVFINAISSTQSNLSLPILPPHNSGSEQLCDRECGRRFWG